MSIPALYQIGKVNSRENFTYLDIYLCGKKRQHPFMDSKEIRRENAKALSALAGGNTAFANMTGIPEARVSHLIGINPSKNIGDKTARKIEEAFKKEKGWLDRTHDPKADKGSEEKSQRHKKPAPAPPSIEEMGEWVFLLLKSQPENRKNLLIAVRAMVEEIQGQN